MTDPMLMMTLFDKQVQLRMGQANVRRWSDEIMPLLLDDRDPLGVESFATHHLPLSEGAAAYKMFPEKSDGAIKIVLKP
jgi:threonine dehydrogenase-like Zn-dependent dehydrogenase